MLIINKGNLAKKAEVIICICIIISVLFLTVGYSSFQSSLDVENIGAIVDVFKDIRVTNITLDSVGYNATSSDENYNTSRISSSIDLPNANSEVVYNVEVINIGNTMMGIYELNGLPSNLKYSIENYDELTPICDDNDSSVCILGAKKNLTIKISYDTNGYNSSNTTYDVALDFDFRRIFNITYPSFSITTGLPTYIMEGQTKTVTFNSTTTIPDGVSVSGASGSYTSPVLTITNAISDVVVYRGYHITYVLNGGTQAQGQAEVVMPGEMVRLLNPERIGYSFLGWYLDSEFQGNIVKELVNLTSDVVLYAKWNRYEYYADNLTFDGTTANVVDTGINLYSTSNVNKNFRVKFTVDSFDSSYENTANIDNNKPPTIAATMVETSAPYSGFTYRIVKNSNTSVFSTKINDTDVTSYLSYYDLTPGTSVEIVREDGIMYMKVNSNIFTKALDYEGSIDTFDIPLTFGANIDKNGNYDRLFKGSLSDVSVEFFEGSIVNDNLAYREYYGEDSYRLVGTINFDGAKYIDTGLNLYSPDNINKDFDITLTVDKFGATVAQSTLINGKDESQNNVWPGFAYRYKSGTNFDFTARWPNVSNTVSALDPMTAPKNIKISRRSGVIYYSVNGEADKKLITVDPNALTNPINTTLTFGASIDASGNPQRFFKGEVSDITVILYDE